MGNVSEILQLVEIIDLLIATSLGHRNRILECWNAGDKKIIVYHFTS